MSALLADAYEVPGPRRAHLHLVPEPVASSPRGMVAPVGALALTRRGLAVIMGLFVGVVAAAAFVLVAAFLSVSDAPLSAAAVAPAVAASAG